MKAPQIFKSDEGRKAILAGYDEILTRWPVAYESLELPTRHGKTFVLACGEPSNPPLVLLHGSSSNSAMWIGDMVEFCRHYRVYAVDLPGEPGRSEPVRADLTSLAPAEWLEDVFTALMLEQAYLEGISLGGWHALRFATVHPEKVRKLVLLCPAGVAPQKASFMWFALPMMFLGEWGADRIIRAVNGRQAIHEEAVRYSKLIALQFNPRIETLPIFSDEELRRLGMPTLLIVGTQDILLPSEKTAARLQSLLPRLTAQVLPDHGHVLVNLADRVVSFLACEKLAQLAQ